MPATAIDFSQDKFEEGQAAFARGVGLDVLVKQLKVESQDPHAYSDGSYGDITDAQHNRYRAEQIEREKKCAGLALGYANGLFQAIRRLDNQMSLPQ